MEKKRKIPELGMSREWRETKCEKECHPENKGQKKGWKFEFLKTVTTALPLSVWLLMILVSFVMAHSESDFRWFALTTFWNHIHWWHKPKIFSSDQN